MLQRQAERQSHSIVLGGRKKLKEFCYDLKVQRDNVSTVLLLSCSSTLLAQQCFQDLLAAYILRKRRCQGLRGCRREDEPILAAGLKHNSS